jgi:hypothetical protein
MGKEREGDSAKLCVREISRNCKLEINKRKKGENDATQIEQTKAIKYSYTYIACVLVVY